MSPPFICPRTPRADFPCFWSLSVVFPPSGLPLPGFLHPYLSDPSRPEILMPTRLPFPQHPQSAFISHSVCSFNPLPDSGRTSLLPYFTVGYGALCLSTATITKYHGACERTEQQTYFSRSSGGWKSEIRVGILVSGEGCLHGLWTLALSACRVLSWPFVGVCAQDRGEEGDALVILPFLIRALNLPDQGPP